LNALHRLYSLSVHAYTTQAMGVFTVIDRPDGKEESQDLRFKCCEVLEIMQCLAHDCCLVCLCMHTSDKSSLQGRDAGLHVCVPSGGGDDHGMLCQRPGTQGGLLQRCKTLTPSSTCHLSVCACLPACLNMSVCLQTPAGRCHDHCISANHTALVVMMQWQWSGSSLLPQCIYGTHPVSAHPLHAT